MLTCRCQWLPALAFPGLSPVTVSVLCTLGDISHVASVSKEQAEAEKLRVNGFLFLFLFFEILGEAQRDKLKAHRR